MFVSRIKNIAVFLVLLLFMVGSQSAILSAAAQSTSYDCGSIEGLRILDRDLKAQADGGWELFDSLSVDCQDAYVEAQSVAYVEVVRNDASVHATSSTQGVLGCNNAVLSAYHYTYLGNVAYRYVYIQRFCADGNFITSIPTTTHYIDQVDPNYYWRGQTASNQYWDPYNTQFYSWRQGRVENCVFKYGCVGNAYPSGWIRSYGSGYWTGGASAT